MSGGGGGSYQDPSDYANIEHDKQVAESNARREEGNKRQQGITYATSRVNSSFDSMFTDDFYKKRESDYIGYYKPQLDDQFADAKEDLTYWLADRGLLGSSVRGDKTADLQKIYDTGLRQTNSGALELTNKTKSSVASARSDLIRDARESADPTSAGTSASGSVQALAQPEIYSSLGDMFGAFTNALQAQSKVETADNFAGSGVGQPQIGLFNTGLFGIKPDSVTLLR